MNTYLVSNISGRKHKKIYLELGDSAIFDLSPSQDGWDDFAKIDIGDAVFVINENLNVALKYNISKILDGVLLDDKTPLADSIAASSGGDVRVIFGFPCKRVDIEYSKFIRTNNIKNSKISPKTNKMYPGFNCTAFSSKLEATEIHN